MSVAFDTPVEVMQTLCMIENDLANRQNGYEEAARQWFETQREAKRVWASTLLTSRKASVAEKRAEADLAVADRVDGLEHEAEYEAIKAVIRVLEQRSMIAMAVLKAQGRA